MACSDLLVKIYNPRSFRIYLTARKYSGGAVVETGSKDQDLFIYLFQDWCQRRQASINSSFSKAYLLNHAIKIFKCFAFTNSHLLPFLSVGPIRFWLGSFYFDQHKTFCEQHNNSLFKSANTYKLHVPLHRWWKNNVNTETKRHHNSAMGLLQPFLIKLTVLIICGQPQFVQVLRPRDVLPLPCPSPKRTTNYIQLHIFRTSGIPDMIASKMAPTKLNKILLAKQITNTSVYPQTKMSSPTKETNTSSLNIIKTNPLLVSSRYENNMIVNDTLAQKFLLFSHEVWIGHWQSSLCHHLWHMGYNTKIAL